MWRPEMYSSCRAATCLYSSLLMVCLVAFVESSTMKVDRVLRESTRAFTTTLPNSVIWLFGIFSVSSRSRSAVGFHSTDAAFTSYATSAPPLERPSRPMPSVCRRVSLTGFRECTPTTPDQLRGPAPAGRGRYPRSATEGEEREGHRRSTGSFYRQQGANCQGNTRVV